ncbi:hypothetical protein GW915_04845 [bacterium]|nr:hypothetical protein [bacterium]
MIANDSRPQEDLKNMYSVTLKTAVLSALGAFSISAFSTPVQSNECSNGKVIHKPKNASASIDSGYFTDKTCETIYVLPPSSGNRTIHSIAENMSKMHCHSIDSKFNILDIIRSKIAENESIPSEKMTEKNKSDLAMLKKYFLSTKEELAEEALYEGNTAHVGYQISWTRLTEAYKKANPSLKVEKLPLRDATANRIAVSSEASKDSSLLPGTHTPFELAGRPSFESRLSIEDAEERLMDSYGLQMTYTLFGTCEFKFETADAIIYNYPLKVAPYKLNFNPEEIAKALVSTSKLRALSLEEAYSAMEAMPKISKIQITSEDNTHISTDQRKGVIRSLIRQSLMGLTVPLRADTSGEHYFLRDSDLEINLSQVQAQLSEILKSNEAEAFDTILEVGQIILKD